jgi:hypothetical protein
MNIKEIIEKIKPSMKDEVKKLPITILKFFLGFIIVVIALFGITFDSIAKKIFYNTIPFTAIYLREEELKCLRVGFSKEYIESKLGVPKSVSEIQMFGDTYFKAIYTDEYYTLLCFYNQNSSLLGYMMVSNKEGFEFNSYRSDIKLLKHSVSEARKILKSEGIEGDIINKEHLESDRMDNNKYYYECKMQHSREAQEPYYIGFGYSDIGYHNAKMEPEMDKENVKINFITVFRDYSCDDPEGIEKYDAIKFIEEKVITDLCAGISKGGLTNLSEFEDYNQKIGEYLDELQ